MPKKVLKGIINSVIDDKTLKVVVMRSMLLPKLRKIVRRSKSYLVHNPNSESFKVNDYVSIIESNPISKRKSWVINKD
jgi:small subunit ribosomal protein S17